MWNSFIWLIDKILSRDATPGQRKPGSDGNEGVLRILQGSSYTHGTRWGCSYPSAEMQSGYSTASADWAWKISS